jgi:hypothetical protein
MVNPFTWIGLGAHLVLLMAPAFLEECLGVSGNTFIKITSSFVCSLITELMALSAKDGERKEQ